MLACKQVARALADHRYWELPLHRRWGLRLHVFLCAVCGRYHRQVMFMQRAAHLYTEHEQVDAPPQELRLSADARARIRQSLAARPNP